MFSFVIPTLIAVWRITRADAGKIGTTMLIASAVGGWIAGYLSDRIPRSLMGLGFGVNMPPVPFY